MHMRHNLQDIYRLEFQKYQPENFTHTEIGAGLYHLRTGSQKGLKEGFLERVFQSMYSVSHTHVTL